MRAQAWIRMAGWGGLLAVVSLWGQSARGQKDLGSTGSGQQVIPEAADPAVVATEAWVGRALILRGFPAGDTLDYDGAGHLQKPGKVTDWTLSGMELEHVTRRGTQLELSGTRVAIRYNPGQHQFERHALKGVTLKVRVPAGDMERELQAVFSVGIDPALEHSMPPPWSHYFVPSLPWPGEELPYIKAAAKLTDSVVLPVAEHKVEPEFTPEARADKVKGTVQLSLVVGLDGTPRRIVVRQPLGYGLDAQAVEAARKDRFQPGTSDGQPAAIEVFLNQSFDIP